MGSTSAIRRRQNPPVAAATPRRALVDSIEQPTPAPTRRGGAAVRWSGSAVLGRQLSQLLAALVLARVLGPDDYGVISAATVYATLTTLLLDQGLAAAVVQRPVISRSLPGAVATVNLLTAALLATVTWFAAPAVAAFFSAPELTGLLQILGLGLLLKGIAVTPRALQQRQLGFKTIGVADIGGGVIGALAGITAVLLGAGIWSMAVQVLVTDAIIAAGLIAFTRGYPPNLHLQELRSILPFSVRIFSSNALAFLSRNADNVMVGRFLGVKSLSLYSMAYRVLVIPVQMVGQTMNRVAFPTFSRLADQRERLAEGLLKTTELLAFAAVPVMSLVAVAAPELVAIVLGQAWAAAAPVLTILAIAGARETVFSVTHSLMRALGRGKLILRYELLATGCQVSGIVVGLQFGVTGVALGLTAAGFLLVPVLLVIQRRLTGVKISSQLLRIAAPGYLLIRWLDAGMFFTLLVGSGAYILVALACLLVAHRPALRRALGGGKEIFGGRSAAQGSVTSTNQPRRKTPA
jgi:O-antigen/teichoic acid export membrane protein